MKQLYTMLVWTNSMDRMEKLLGQFRIGLNEWDKTRAFDYQGGQVVSYTILCDESVFVSITNIMNGITVY